eukprot:1713842-Prymnesium_polylepis.1
MSPKLTHESKAHTPPPPPPPPRALRWYEMVCKTLEELGIGHFYLEYNPEEEYGIYFIIDKPDNLFSWDQVGWKTALSDDCAAGSSDSTLRVDKYDYGQVVAEQASHKISITGGCTLSCKALPAL